LASGTDQKIRGGPTVVRHREPDPARGVYSISVAAELVGSQPQSLRLYESRGLVMPGRSDGGTRRYSEDDLDRLRSIGTLLEAGLNLAGVVMVLELRATNEALRRQLDEEDGGS
jgi:MerR family transcriptional regulator/heat shock protein HspR